MIKKKEEVIKAILDYFTEHPDNRQLTIDFFYEYLYELKMGYQESDIYEAFSKLVKDGLIYFPNASKNVIQLSDLGKVIAVH